MVIFTISTDSFIKQRCVVDANTSMDMDVIVFLLRSDNNTK